MPNYGLAPGQGGAPGVSYWVVQLQPGKVAGRARGYMLPPCTFTLLPLLVLSFIYFLKISCALHSKDSSAPIFQSIIYKVSSKEKKYFVILNIWASWPNLFSVVLLVVDVMWRSHCCCLSSHVWHTFVGKMLILNANFCQFHPEFSVACDWFRAVHHASWSAKMLWWWSFP